MRAERPRSSCRKPKYANASFRFDSARFHGRMSGSVTYSNVNDTRISPSADGVMR